jgi:DNA-binding CsgD family transcriptional regulator
MDVESFHDITRERGFFPFFLGFAFLHTWIHATVTAPVYSLQADNFFVFSVSSGTLLVTLLAVVLCARQIAPAIGRPVWLGTVAALSILGTLLMSANLPFLFVSPPLTIVATAFTALGTGGFLAVWGEGYARLGSTRALIIATFAALVTSFFLYLLINSFPEIPALLITSLLPAFSALCAHTVLKKPPLIPKVELPTTTIPHSHWGLPMKLLAYIFAFSVPMNLLNLQISVVGGGITRDAWSLVFSCALLVVALAIAGEFVLQKRNSAVLPILTVLLATGSLLYFLFIHVENLVLTYIFLYAGYYLFIATFYSHLGLIAQRARKAPFVVFAVGNCINVLGLLFGSLIGYIVERLDAPWNYVVIIVVVYALFFVGFVLMSQLRRNIFVDPHVTTLPAGTASRSLADCVEEHCRIVASRMGLTSREEEILNYVVRGRSTQSIATATHLSQNTVKTHVHHLHQKLNAHSREEIIVLVESLNQTRV